MWSPPLQPLRLSLTVRLHACLCVHPTCHIVARWSLRGDCTDSQTRYFFNVALNLQVRDDPRHGAANATVVKMIAKALNVKIKDVEITRGFASEEDKHMVVRNRQGASTEQIVKRLSAAVSQ